jgi:hypothetical protein
MLARFSMVSILAVFALGSLCPLAMALSCFRRGYGRQ